MPFKKRVTTLIILSSVLLGFIFSCEVWETNLSSDGAQTDSWVMTGSLNQKRAVFADCSNNMRMATLSDGMVIALSGKTENPRRFYPSCEIYNPRTGTWSYTGSLPSGAERDGFSCPILPDGRILLVGGRGEEDLPTCFIYDPRTKRWSQTGDLPWAGDGVGAVMLNNGKVLATGGRNQYTKKSVSSCALYDPNTGVWTSTTNMINSRSGGYPLLLRDGRVLCAGGYSTDPEAINDVLGTCEIYDPETKEWSPTGNLNLPRNKHFLVLLNNGKVLAAGGMQFGSAMVSLVSCELYDSNTRVWTYTGSLPIPTGMGAGVLLLDGRFLATGGLNLGGRADNGKAWARCEIYDPATEQWTSIANLNVARDHHAIALVHDRTVLVSGGRTGQSRYLSSCELYQLPTPTGVK